MTKTMAAVIFIASAMAASGTVEARRGKSARSYRFDGFRIGQSFGRVMIYARSRRTGNHC